MQAGARTVPMTSQTLAIARLASDPGSNWKAENASVTEGADPTFERVTLTAQTLISFIRTSRELLEDAVNMSDVLRSAFAKALALKLDLAALYGSGVSPVPKGVKNQSGIATISMGTNGAQLTNYDPFVDQAATLWGKNFDTPNAFIMAPRTRQTVGKLKDTTNQPLQAPSEIAGVPRYDTTQVPINLTQGTSNVASDLFGGRWENLLIGVRHDVTIEVLQERYAADNFQVGFVAHLRADVQVAHPEAFAVTVGIIP
jgi:HK97 family phage major capsid protein